MRARRLRRGRGPLEVARARWTTEGYLVGREGHLRIPLRVIAGCVCPYVRRGRAAQQRIHRLPLRRAQEIPQGQIDAAESHDRNAAPSVGDRGCVQPIPQTLDIRGAGDRLVQQQLPQVAVDHLHRSPAAAAVPVAVDAHVGLHAHDDLP